MALGRTTSVGIDIGTHSIKVIVAEQDIKQDKKETRIIGWGAAESKGIRHGYITNAEEATKSVKQAVTLAERSSGIKIKKAYLSIGGMGISAVISTGGIVTTKADTEITDLDVKRAVDESEKEIPQTYILNRKIIHIIPLEYRIDGRKVLGKPNGLKGIKLEARVMYITCLSHHVNSLMLTMEEAGIEIEDIVASPMASSIVSLSKTQKIAGCVLANIGSETTSIIIFENNIPISLEFFPYGSNDITNDIALGLKITLEDAELVKTGTVKGIEFSKKKLDEIVIARLSDIFDLIENHLKKIDRNGLLPAGIILTGGGAGLQHIEEYAKAALKLPSKQGHLKMEGLVKAIPRDHEWTVAYGLAVLGLSSDDTQISDTKSTIGFLSQTKSGIWKWIKQFLP